MEHLFTVTGMTCGHCEASVKEAILECDAQASVEIDRPNNRVVVKSSAPRETLAAAIREEGYEVAE